MDALDKLRPANNWRLAWKDSGEMLTLALTAEMGVEDVYPGPACDGVEVCWVCLTDGRTMRWDCGQWEPCTADD